MTAAGIMGPFLRWALLTGAVIALCIASRLTHFAAWALLTGAVIALVLAGSWWPGLYFLASILLPVPLALLVLFLDSRFAAACLLLAGALLFTWTNTGGMFFTFLEKGLLGIFMGILLKNRVRADKALAASAAAAVLLSFAAGLCIFVAGGGNVLALDEEMRHELLRAVSVWQDMGTVENLPFGRQSDFASRVVYYYELLLPGQYALSAAVLGALSFCAASLASAAFKYTLPPGPGFSRIYCPWYIIWGLIAGLGLVLAGDQFSLRVLINAGLNILFVLFYVFLLLGLSVFIFFWKYVRFPAVLRVLVIIISLFYLPLAVSALLFLGITDPLVNYRRLPGEKS